MRAALAGFRAVLALAPPAFRRLYGREAEAAFVRLVMDYRARRGPVPSAAIAVRAILDAIGTVIVEWWRCLSAANAAGGTDLRQALRMFARQPVHAASIVLTLGVTAGALTGAFAFVDPILFRPLALPEADRVVVAHAFAGRGPFNRLRAEDYVRVREQTTTLQHVSSYYGVGFGEVAAESTRELRAVTPDFLALTQTTPIIGRAFRPEEHRRIPAKVALITHGFWQSAYSGRADVVGQSFDVHLYGGRDRYEIVGVLPKTFMFPAPPSAGGALAALLPGNLEDGPRGGSLMPLIARLRPGVTIEQAQAEVAAIIANVDRTSAARSTPRLLTLRTLPESLFGDVSSVLRLIFLGSACVLLVGCVNLAQLVSARLRARGQDLAVRRALGASTGRLVRMLAAEAAALAFAGALIAAFVAKIALVALANTVPYYETAYRHLPFVLDPRALGFLAAITMCSTLLMAGWPILHATAISRQRQRDGARVSRRTRGEAVFVGAQSAMAMGLVVCSLQVVSAYAALSRQAGGFDPDGLRFLSVTWSAGAVKSHSPAAHDLMRRSFESLERRFGTAVAAFGGMPGGVSAGQAARADGPEVDQTGVHVLPVSASGFHLLGTRLLAGRLFDEQEAWTDAPVAVIDRRGAELLFPGQDPIGRQVRGLAGRSHEIVGLVETLGLVTAPGQLKTGSLFTPFSRSEQASFNIMFREPSGSSWVDAATGLLRAVHSNVLVQPHPYLPFERALGAPRFAAAVLGSLSLLAVGLAGIGLFGMITHAITARRKELAVRMALGARARDVQSAVVRTHVLAGLLGLAMGAALALRATVLLQPVSAGMRPDDPILFGTAALVLLTVILLASYLPARRAARIDPAVALRAE